MGPVKKNVPRYWYSVLALKSTSIPVLGTFSKVPRYRYGTRYGTLQNIYKTAGVARNSDGWVANLKKICDIILVAFFDDVMVMTS